MSKASKRTLARIEKFAHFTKANQERDAVKVGTGHVFGSLVGCRWPVDIAELAQRIDQTGEKSVSNAARDLVAKMLPLGSVTRRDGSSIRPRYRDTANI